MKTAKSILYVTAGLVLAYILIKMAIAGIVIGFILNVIISYFDHARFLNELLYIDILFVFACISSLVYTAYHFIKK